LGGARILRAKKPVANEYIVKLKSGAVAARATDAQAAADHFAGKYRGSKKHVFHHALQGFSMRMTESDALALSQDPQVELVEENSQVDMYAVQSNAPWGLDRIDQASSTLDTKYDNSGLDGLGVTVYIIDSGIRTTHSEFEGRASVGADFVGDGRNGQDALGHGTHVAGTIAGKTFGVAKKAQVVAVRVLDKTGYATRDIVIAGIDWVSANHVAGAIANMSLGGGDSKIEDDAVRSSIAAGVVYVLAAGNDGSDGLSSPARVTEAITVGALDRGDSVAYFSNYGGGVDLFAPGVDIESAFYIGDNATKIWSGTSMATPHVAGLAALYRQAMPTATPAVIGDAIIGSATQGTIPNAGPSSPNRVAYLGTGIVGKLSDGFESGTSAWTVVDGTWALASDGSQTYQGTSTTGFVRTTALTSMTDQVIQAQVKPVSFTGSDRFAMVMGRYTDTSNYYYLALRSSGKVQLNRVKAGTTTTLATTNYAIAAGTWYNVKLEIVGTSLQGYVNGTMLVAATDSGLTSGKVGLGGQYAQTRFDSVLVSVPATGSSTAATHPYPSAGAATVDPRSILTWTAGRDAVSHDVYFGTTNPPAFVVNTTVPHYAAPLVNGTTYYWRIDEHLTTGAVVTGTAWSFTTGFAPGKATAPTPWNGAGNLPQFASLAWETGDGATSHTVYLGTENPPSFGRVVPIEDGTSTYCPVLQPGMTYYWRVDSTNGDYTTTGDVWTFSTGGWPDPTSFPGWASNPSPVDGAKNVSVQSVVSWTPPTVPAGQTMYLEALFDTHHEIQVSATDPAGSRYTPTQPLLCNTNYLWSIVSPTNDWPPPPTWSFMTGNPGGAPGFASITSPADNQEGVGLTPTITWTAAAGATSYEVYVCDVGIPESSCYIDTAPYTTTSTSYTLPAMTPDTWHFVGIVARNSVCGTRGGSILFNTIADPAVPPPSSAASNPSPANGATLTTAARVLSWTLGAGATRGALYIGTSSTSLQYVDEETTIHLARDFTPNQTYYWRVDSINAGGRSQGPVWSFTTGPRVVPGAPSNPTPASGALGVDASTYSVSLSWTEGAGTTKADIYFGTSSNPPLVQANLTTDISGARSSSSVGWVEINSCAQYYWRVVEKNDAGGTSGPVWTFTTQFLLPDTMPNCDPSDGAVNVSPNPKFWWNDAAGATSFSLWLAPDGSPLVEVSHNQTSNEFVTPTLATYTTYHWQAVAHNPAGDTASPVWTFTTGGPDGVALNPSPADGATGVSPLATLTWTPGQGAANEYVYISWDDVSRWKQLPAWGGAADPGPLLENTLYFWRVDQVDAAGNVTNSAFWSFRTGTSSALPGAPVYSGPPNDATGYGIRPTFTWTPGAGATQHHLYLWPDSEPHPQGYEFIQPDALFIPGFLRPNTHYAWFAGEENANGIRRGPTWHFTTGSSQVNMPGPASNPNPANAATGIATAPTLTWTAGSDAASHDVYFGTTNPPVLVGNQTAASFAPTAALANSTTYYWRIDERNAAGVTTGTVWSFTTSAATSGPCAGLCTNPTIITVGSGGYGSGSIGTGSTCYQTTSVVRGGNCGNFVSPRTLSVNGVQETCNNQNWSSLPATRNGGYCLQTTAGNYSYAYFTLY
jgi:subtilisin family serine protease